MSVVFCWLVSTVLFGAVGAVGATWLPVHGVKLSMRWLAYFRVCAKLVVADHATTSIFELILLWSSSGSAISRNRSVGGSCVCHCCFCVCSICTVIGKVTGDRTLVAIGSGCAIDGEEPGARMIGSKARGEFAHKFPCWDCGVSKMPGELFTYMLVSLSVKKSGRLSARGVWILLNNWGSCSEAGVGMLLITGEGGTTLGPLGADASSTTKVGTVVSVLAATCLRQI